MNDYATVSFLVAAGGLAAWFTAWQGTTRLLPWNRRRSAAYAGLDRTTLVVGRIGFWVFLVGLANLVLAVILIQVTS